MANQLYKCKYQTPEYCNMNKMKTKTKKMTKKMKMKKKKKTKKMKKTKEKM